MSEVYQDQLDFAKSNRITDVVLMKAEVGKRTWFVLKIEYGPVLGKFSNRAGAVTFAKVHGFTITNPV
jgi:hypothetical protein